LNPSILPAQIVSAIWQPTNVSGLTLWLDANDTTTIDRVGASVTQWRSKVSGTTITIGGTGGLTYGNNTGNTGARASINTAPGLTSYFSVPVDIRKTVRPNITIFLVYAWIGRTSPTAQTLWGNDVPNQSNRVQMFDFSSVFNPNSYGYFLNNGYLYNTTELNRSTTQLYGIISQVGVTNGTGIYFNGSIGSGGFGTELVNTPIAGNEILYFGGGETSAIYPSYTQFNEIIYYPSALSTQERQTVEGYLAWKWGLVANLPQNHPFKLWPPPP
jgi:hypothetical protein